MTPELLDLDRLAAAERVREPFAYVVVPGFVRAERVAEVLGAFPAIRAPGSFPAERAGGGPAFRALIGELTSGETAAALGAALGLSLAGAPTMATVRGRCRAEDGRIHTDSTAKLVSALLYLNPSWHAAGGRLRLLRSDDLDDALVEVPPEAGMLVAFRRSEASFHGHLPFVGERRSVQVNWMRSGLAAMRELMRHRVSARVKRARGAA